MPVALFFKPFLLIFISKPIILSTDKCTVYDLIITLEPHFNIATGNGCGTIIGYHPADDADNHYHAQNNGDSLLAVLAAEQHFQVLDREKRLYPLANAGFLFRRRAPLLRMFTR